MFLGLGVFCGMDSFFVTLTSISGVVPPSTSSESGRVCRTVAAFWSILVRIFSALPAKSCSHDMVARM
uniref:Putative secreted protein n=1 Tax=Anopheles marajoara TaxID=58244 RepID=A0A2M4CFC0_9DIPT